MLNFYLSLANKRTHKALTKSCNKSAAAGSTPLSYVVEMNDELKAQVLILPPGCFYYGYTRIFFKTTTYMHKYMNINKKKYENGEIIFQKIYITIKIYNLFSGKY